MAPSTEAVEDAFAELRRVTSFLHAHMRAAFSERGITPPQAMLLRLVRAAGRTTPGELAEALGVTAGSVTGHLNRLEDEGLVTRTRSSRDKRVQYVRLTEKSHGLAKEMYDEAIAELGRVFGDFTDDELATLAALLRRIGPEGGESCAPGATD